MRRLQRVAGLIQASIRVANDRRSLIRTILDHPEEDTPKLVLADWEDEFGDPKLAQWLRTWTAATRHFNEQKNPVKGSFKTEELDQWYKAHEEYLEKLYVAAKDATHGLSAEPNLDFPVNMHHTTEAKARNFLTRTKPDDPNLRQGIGQYESYRGEWIGTKLMAALLTELKQSGDPEDAVRYKWVHDHEKRANSGHGGSWKWNLIGAVAQEFNPSYDARGHPKYVPDHVKAHADDIGINLNHPVGMNEIHTALSKHMPRIRNYIDHLSGRRSNALN
jgi:uncharacterized protein (TIGR02996 family)